MNAEPTSKLAEVLGTLAIQLQAQPDAATTLRGIVDAAVDIVPGARWAGISLIHGREYTGTLSRVNQSSFIRRQ